MAEEDKVVLKLIRLIDNNSSVIPKDIDAYGNRSSKILLVSFAVFFFSALCELILFSKEFSEYIVGLIALGALVVGFYAFLTPFLEKNVLNSCYKRLETCHGVEKDEKPLLKALIKMKIRHREFNLMDVYTLERSLFTRNELLKFLYDKT